MSMALLRDMGHHIQRKQGSHMRERDFLFQQLSVTVQCGNRVFVLGATTIWHPWPCLYFAFTLPFVLLLVACYFAYIMFHCTSMFCFAVRLLIVNTYSSSLISSLILISASTLFWYEIILSCTVDFMCGYNVSMTTVKEIFENRKKQLTIYTWKFLYWICINRTIPWAQMKAKYRYNVVCSNNIQ